jgi:hypothetical protein
MLEYYRITWMNILYLAIGGWSSVGLVWILSSEWRRRLLELQKWKAGLETKALERKQMHKIKKGKKK